MEEVIFNLLNDWAVYSDYDKEKTTFKINGWEFEVHRINEKVEYLLKEYDETGILSIIAIKQDYQKILKDMRINLFELFRDYENGNAEINKHYEMYKKLYSKEIREYENEYYKKIGMLVQAVLGKPLLTDGNDMSEEYGSLFGRHTDSVLQDLKKCRLNVYKKGGTVGKITRISTQIYVFPSIAECLLALEKAEDGMYLTYIDVHQSPDSFFGFFIKSNGNLFSFDERIPEAYRGSHQHSRSGRWAENKADSLFPYDYIFEYSNYDHKGYSMTYQIQEDKLQFLNLEEDVYVPLLLAMVFVSRKFSEKELTEDVVYLDTMLSPNLEELAENSTELAVIEKSALVVQHQNLNLHFEPEKVLNGDYDEEFLVKGGMGSLNGGKMFVEMYADGFSFNINDIIRRPSTEKLLEDKTETYLTEFVGSESSQRLQVYYEIRKELASYIREQMKKEYINFGGIESYKKWFENAVQNNLKNIEAMIAERYFNNSFQRVGWGSADANILCNIHMEEDTDYPSEAWGAYRVNQNEDYEYKDIRTGTKCSTFITISPKNWKGVQQLVGENVLKLVKGWNRDGHMTSGNSILDVTDTVEAVGTPFEYYECDNYKNLFGKNESSHYAFQVVIAYSKRGFKRMLKEFQK